MVNKEVKVIDIYFVMSGLSNNVELPTVQEIKPKHILVSYYYFRTISLDRLIDKIGYNPKIMLDSGAYSAWNKEKIINLEDYLEYIDNNKDYIDEYIALDVIGKPKETYNNYLKMLELGYNPMPVYHYGSDKEYLYKYSKFTNRIALGNTVPERNKSIVANWINDITKDYSYISFHLLGSSSKKIITRCPNLTSCDSSTYVMQAIMGNPPHLNDKVDRGIYNMNEILEYNQLPKVEQISLF